MVRCTCFLAAMEFKPPKGLSLEGDVAQNWKNFIQKFNIFIQANEYEEKSDQIKVAMLLNCIGDEGLHLFNTLSLTVENRKKFSEVIKAFESYCIPRKSTVFNRYKFFTRTQKEGELFDHFHTELKKLAQECEFGDQQDSLIRDKIIIGIRDTNLQERLLRENNLTLTKTVEVCRIFEASKIEAKSLQGNTDKEANINLLKRNKFINKDKKGKQNKFNCTRCKKEHCINECPAYGQKCHACGKLNHFKIACKSISNKNKKKKEVHNVTETSDGSSEGDETDLFSIDNLVEGSKKNKKWEHKIFIENKPVSFKLDTGADINVLPYNIYLSVCPEIPLQINKTKVMAYGGFQVNTKGLIEVICTPENRDPAELKFVVIDTSSPPVLSLSSCIQLNLINKIELLQTEETKEKDNEEERREFLERNNCNFAK